MGINKENPTSFEEMAKEQDEQEAVVENTAEATEEVADELGAPDEEGDKTDETPAE